MIHILKTVNGFLKVIQNFKLTFSNNKLNSMCNQNKKVYYHILSQLAMIVVQKNIHL
jgi:hypothetical protein